MTSDFELSGFSKDIFKNRYAFTEEETWVEACQRVAHQMAIVEKPEKVEKYKDKFYQILIENKFVPGGRIWYGSGRPNPNLLNCFVLGCSGGLLDSKEGWGNISREMIITSMCGGGCGVDFTDVRPKGAAINGQRGTCPGSVELMKLLNGNGRPVRAGGNRRIALLFSLSLSHPDIEDFLNAKLNRGELDLANISVLSHNTTDFIEAIKNDYDWELSWKGQYKRKIKARKLWNIIVKNAYNCSEPGFLNWELVNNENTINYIEKLVTCNPCFSEDTLIVTNEGLYPIKDLVQRNVNIWNGESWQFVNNFRVTGTNQQLLKITMQDGSELRVTPQHNMILEDGQRIKAQHLEVGQKLQIGETVTNGVLNEPSSYLKGFLVGDGSSSRGNPILWLYNTKYSCQDRLLASAAEIAPTSNYNNITLQGLSFSEEDKAGRKTLKGLTSRSEDLLKWATEYKKELPKVCFRWDYKSKCEFIAGILDADGSALDTKNGFGYQLWSVNRRWLQDFQILLKTIGVFSKISKGKDAEIKTFNGGYGEYSCKESFRLTISQKNSIKLSKQVKFSRLTSFEDKSTKHKVKPKFNKIESIEFDEIAEKVYCCTIEGSHSLSIGIGVHTGQCGEINLGSYQSCCLGHLVLPRFIEDNSINWHALGNTIRTAVRFLDNVLDVNNFPLKEMKEKSDKLRRIGLGTTGLADMLILLGYKYGSDEANKFIDKLYRFISKIAYESSIMLAIEKGPFELCQPDKHIKSGFVKRMPKKIKELISEHGIRNCGILTQAPVGTTSILSGNCSSGIEPIFSAAYERRFYEEDKRKTELVFHPLFAEFIEDGKSLENFITSKELSVREHLEVQKVIQKHVDHAISKTVNISKDYSVEDISKIWLEYLPYLKGVTFYREDSRGFVDSNGQVKEPPLVSISINEAKKRYKRDIKKEVVVDCKDGSCNI